MEKEIIAYQNNRVLIDTQSATDLDFEKVYFDNSKEVLEVLRHSYAYLMIQAIKVFYPEAKFFAGPVIEDGFYYDFRVNSKFNGEDLIKIEKKMKELAEAKLEIQKYTLSKQEALEKFKDDDLKQEVLAKILSDEVSIYKQGEFEGLCRGPYASNTKFLRLSKLTRTAGAYLGGDERREMLTRIYGTALADKESLKEYLHIIEEAKKRDHRKPGNELKLFIFDKQIGGGLPIWLSSGARLRSKLEQMPYKIHRLGGYEPVRGPELLKAEAWKISGHYANYKENMYFTNIDEQEYGIKPMNCVGYTKIYQDEVRSCRDLSLKFFEYGVVHRHEKSRILHGLFRVRESTQDDTHVLCMPSQIKEQVLETLDFVASLTKIFDFEYEMGILTHPEKVIDDEAIWEVATKTLKEVLDEQGLKYDTDEGGGAFYGPKIGIKIIDALKRKRQYGIIQVDLNLPECLELEYTSSGNAKERPVTLHRATLGSFERSIGILTEHYAGEFPFFIASTQVGMVSISEVHLTYTKGIRRTFLEMGADSEIYDKNESLSKKIRNAERQKLPMTLAIGDEELSNRTMALRDRRAKEQKSLSLDEFMNLIKEKINEVAF